MSQSCEVLSYRGCPPKNWGWSVSGRLRPAGAWCSPAEGSGSVKDRAVRPRRRRPRRGDLDRFRPRSYALGLPSYATDAGRDGWDRGSRAVNHRAWYPWEVWARRRPDADRFGGRLDKRCSEHDAHAHPPKREMAGGARGHRMGGLAHHGFTRDAAACCEPRPGPGLGWVVVCVRRCGAGRCGALLVGGCGR